MIDSISKIKVYPLTDEKYLFEKSHSERISEVIRGGAKMVQLRDKSAPMEILYREAMVIREITKNNDVCFIVNDRVDLAKLCGADGVHLGQEDLPVESARDILGDKAIIGVSTHSLEQVRNAMVSSADYIAFGPVFPTLTKNNPNDVAGIDILKRIVDMVDKPLFAIGGINISRFMEVLKKGVTGVALISDIFAYPDAAKKMNDYLCLASDSVTEHIDS